MNMREKEPQMYPEGKEETPKPEEETEKVEKAEAEQTPEEIREVLEKALEEECPVDLVILDYEDGRLEQVLDLIVEIIYDDYVMMSYFDYERNETGEGIPLSISRIKKAELRKPQK